MNERIQVYNKNNKLGFYFNKNLIYSSVEQINVNLKQSVAVAKDNDLTSAEHNYASSIEFFL